MKNLIRLISMIILIILPLIILSGCASIFKGPNDRIRLNSNPVGADIYINGDFAGKAPLRFSLKASKSYIIEFKKDGYTSCTYHVNSEIGAGWIILDIIAGLIPVAIDAVTGSWYYLEPDYLNCNMEKDRI